MLQSFNYVTPDRDNKSTYSFVFASILRDVGSVFDSVVRKLIENTGNQHQHNIYGYLEFLEGLDPALENRTVLMLSNMKRILPFRKTHKGIPSWWQAYNDVKHDETSNVRQGNLQNALISLAALAILNASVCHNLSTCIFLNIGIDYPPNAIDISEERLLFP